MVRRPCGAIAPLACAVSNHEDAELIPGEWRRHSLETRAKSALLRV